MSIIKIICLIGILSSVNVSASERKSVVNMPDIGLKVTITTCCSLLPDTKIIPYPYSVMELPEDLLPLSQLRSLAPSPMVEVKLTRTRNLCLRVNDAIEFLKELFCFCSRSEDEDNG